MFFTTGYASDMNMNGRGMEAKTKTILTYVTEAGGTGQFLTNGRFVITQGAIEGFSHYVAANHVGKQGTGRPCPSPAFQRTKE
ncbi:MAG: hypothetical protein ACLRWQ_15460 [Flavonifractor plautii]